jgi:hypothetical protein
MGLNDDIAAERGAAETRLRRERDSAISELAKRNEEVDTLRRALDVVQRIEQSDLQPPDWLLPRERKKAQTATLVAMLSDLHLDEVVLPEEVDGLNAYNRAIAEIRMRAWTVNTIKMARAHLAGLRYDGLVLLLGGDLFSGDIHEELSETNEDTMIGSLLFWAEHIATAVDMLATEFKHVHIAAVAGNHGRTTRKPRAKLRARTNYDWLLAKMLERHFAKDRRVTFQVPESSDCLVTIYGRGHLLTHGDQAHGGSGIGGIYPPIMRLRARKAQRYLAVGSSFDTIWLGHWHQYLPSPTLVVNGSMKGYDEYAYVNNFQHEQPQQALAVITSHRGIILQAPVFCADREKEGW